MSDKKIFKNKNRNNRNNRSNKNNRGNRNVPSPVARLDDSIIREVSLLLELGATEEVIRKQYNLCYSQIDYIRNNKKPLQTVEQQLLEAKNRKKWGEWGYELSNMS